MTYQENILIENQNIPFIVMSKNEINKLKKCESMLLPSRHVHHLRKVKRKKEELQLYVSAGDCEIVKCTLAKNNTLHGIDIVEIAKKPRQVGLIQSKIKIKNLKFLIQKITELGIDFISIINSDYTENYSIDYNKLSQIIEGACMQSRNPYIPILDICTNSIFNYNFIDSATYYWGSLSVNQRLQKTSTNQTSYFINGPEGGWSIKEHTYLKNNFNEIQLSNYILRSETAAIAFVSQVNNVS